MSFCITTLHCLDRATIFEVIQSFCENTLPLDENPIIWIVLAQGCSTEHIDKLNAFFSLYRNVVESRIVSWDENRGWSRGMNYLGELSRSYKYVLHLEDDWICLPPISSDWLKTCIAFLENNKNVSTLFLRRYKDDHEKHQFGWTRTIPYWIHQNPNNFNYVEKMKSTTPIKYQSFHFQEIPEFLYTANPCIRRNDDYWRAFIFPFPEHQDVRSHGIKWGLTMPDDSSNQQWGFSESLAMEKHLGLTAFYFENGVFGHEENWRNS